MRSLLQSWSPTFHSSVRPPPRRVGFLSQIVCQKRAAFSLVELLAVIVILAILASCLAISVRKARALARQADCKSNMRNLGAAILIYRSDPQIPRSDYGSRNPDWLSCLYPDYVDDLHLFVCRSDTSKGVGRTRPVGITSNDNAIDPQPFQETVDNSSNDKIRLTAGTTWENKECLRIANANISANSYFYEFSAAFCDPNWYPTKSNPTWGEYKEHQLITVNVNNKRYSSSRLPIIRCYHHASEGRIPGFANQDALNSGQITNERITINVAYAGNVYVGPLWWEGAVQPGE